MYLLIIVLVIIVGLTLKYRPVFEEIESGIIIWYTNSYHNDRTPHRVYRYIIRF